MKLNRSDLVIDSAYLESACGEEQAKSVGRSLLAERDAALLQKQELQNGVEEWSKFYHETRLKLEESNRLISAIKDAWMLWHQGKIVFETFVGVFASTFPVDDQIENQKSSMSQLPEKYSL